MTLAWIESQIEETLSAENGAKNVYDLAMLCICRDELKSRAAESSETDKEKRKREAVNIVSHCADLNVVPTIGQIETALNEVPVRSRDDQKRVKDAKTWAQIIRESWK